MRLCATLCPSNARNYLDYPSHRPSYPPPSSEEIDKKIIINNQSINQFDLELLRIMWYIYYYHWGDFCFFFSHQHPHFSPPAILHPVIQSINIHQCTFAWSQSPQYTHQNIPFYLQHPITATAICHLAACLLTRPPPLHLRRLKR